MAFILNSDDAPVVSFEPCGVRSNTARQFSSFIPVVVGAHIIALTDPMPVFRAIRLFAYLRRRLVAGLTECIYVASVGRNGAAPTAGSLLPCGEVIASD